MTPGHPGTCSRVLVSTLHIASESRDSAAAGHGREGSYAIGFRGVQPRAHGSSGHLVKTP
jgi:hypothetical protein